MDNPIIKITFYVDKTSYTYYINKIPLINKYYMIGSLSYTSNTINSQIPINKIEIELLHADNLKIIKNNDILGSLKCIYKNQGCNTKFTYY